MHQSRYDFCSMGSVLAIERYCSCLLHLGSRVGVAPTTSFTGQKHQRFYNALFGSAPSEKDCEMLNRVFDFQAKCFLSGKSGA